MLGWYNLHFYILKYLGSSIKLKGSELKINTKADFLRQHRGSSWNTKSQEFVKDGCRELILRGTHVIIMQLLINQVVKKKKKCHTLEYEPTNTKVMK